MVQMERHLAADLPHAGGGIEGGVDRQADRRPGELVAGNPLQVVVQDRAVRGVPPVYLAVTDHVQARHLLVVHDCTDGVLERLLADGVVDELTLGERGERVPVVPPWIGIVADHRDGQQDVLTANEHRR
jgi:hypothetical protein